MRSLDHHVNFVIPDRFLDGADRLGWPEIAAKNFDAITEHTLTQRCVGSMNNWVVIPYLYFKRAGHDVTHSPAPIDDAINIVSSVDFGIRHRPVRPFIVACRADCHEPKLANYVFEQNNQNAGKPNVSWTPHFPQPGLIPRDASRGAELNVLGYMGETANLYEKFRNEEFLTTLKSLSVDFRLGERTPEKGEPVSMHDYSGVDAIIAVRNLTFADVRNKPASKLVNAWAAGAPALLGPEPAYQELRKSELDYIEVHSPHDALREIKSLKENPKRYAAIIKNGLARAEAFTVASIVEIWIDALNGPVAEAFNKWRKVNRGRKYARWIVSAAAERRSRIVTQKNRISGARPFQD